VSAAVLVTRARSHNESGQQSEQVHRLVEPELHVRLLVGRGYTAISFGILTGVRATPVRV
jgi:hypothetical protein